MGTGSLANVLALWGFPDCSRGHFRPVKYIFYVKPLFEDKELSAVKDVISTEIFGI